MILSCWLSGSQHSEGSFVLIFESKQSEKAHSWTPRRKEFLITLVKSWRVDNKVLLNGVIQSRDCTAWDPRGLESYFTSLRKLFVLCQKRFFLHLMKWVDVKCVSFSVCMSFIKPSLTLQSNVRFQLMRVWFSQCLVTISSCQTFLPVRSVNYLVASGVHVWAHCLVRVKEQDISPKEFRLVHKINNDNFPLRQ